MISLTRPSQESMNRFLKSQEQTPFSYSPVGMTKNTQDAFPGYVRDHNRVELGKGLATFEKASAALRNWEHFNLGWLSVFNHAPIEENSLVGVWATLLRTHIVFACRVVYLIEEHGELEKFGFSYGTLKGHPESGEERFLIEYNRETDTVHYDLLAHSRPGWLVVQLGYPLARKYQHLFIKDSQLKMISASQH